MNVSFIEKLCRLKWKPSDFFYGLCFAAGQVDAEFLGGTVDLVLRFAHLDLASVGRQDFDVEAQGLHLLDEDLERFGDSRIGQVLTLDDGFVDLHTARDVIGLDRQKLLQGVGGAVGLEGPDFHLTEALSTELRLTTERLLGDHRVRSGRTRVDLVVDEVVELEHVHVADRDRVREGLTGATVEQLGLARGIDEAIPVAVRCGRLQQSAQLLLVRTVEDRGGQVGSGLGLAGRRRQLGCPFGVALDLPALLRDPAEVDFEDLADVHTTGNTVGVEDHVDRSSVGEERHVLDRQDRRDDALVSVAAGHLVTDGDLAALGHVDADHLVDARRELIIVLTVEDAHADDGADLTVGNTQRGVADLARLLTEDRTQQPLLRGQLGLTLRGDLADEDVSVSDLGADADDAAIVEVGQGIGRDVRDVPGDLLGAELGVAGVDLVLLDVDRG